MRIQPGQLVPLGHGVWVRSDEVVAIEPIREKRGPGRRALVWVRNLPEPLIASRSEESLLRDITLPREMADRMRKLESGVERLTDAIDRVPPVLLRVVAQETGQDLRAVSKEARRALTERPVRQMRRRRMPHRKQDQEQQPELPANEPSPATP